MKKILLLSVLALSACTVGRAQEKGLTYSWWTQTGFHMSGTPKLLAVDVAAAPGYAFNHRWFVRGHIEAAFDMLHRNEHKTYLTNALLGAGVGYNIVARKANLLDVTLSAGNSLNSNQWNYTWIDLGLHLGYNLYTAKPFFGLGARYYGSHTAGYGDQWNIYVAFGVRFN